jgi:thiamine pyrophosphokinase
MQHPGPEPTPNRFLVVLGGDPVAPPPAPDLADLADGTVVVAADSGLDGAERAGVAVHHLVGDLDSADPAAVARAEAAGTVVHRHPADKDATDAELALDLVRSLARPAGDQVLVVGPGGGRLDHLLADLLLLAGPGLAGHDVVGHLGPATVTVVRPGRPRRVVGRAGEQVSLLAVHGPARGVTTDGLRWALADADLDPGTTRGVSNELLGAEAFVAVAGGTVVVVQPGTAAPHVAPRTTPYDPTPRSHP